MQRRETAQKVQEQRKEDRMKKALEKEEERKKKEREEEERRASRMATPSYQRWKASPEKGRERQKKLVTLRLAKC